MIDDLPEELKLAGAVVDRMAGVGENVRDRPHALVPTRVRDDAEGAEFVAALDDRDVGLEWIAATRDPERE
jgi:hypothetical protein